MNNNSNNKNRDSIGNNDADHEKNSQVNSNSGKNAKNKMNSNSTNSASKTCKINIDCRKNENLMAHSYSDNNACCENVINKKNCKRKSNNHANNDQDSYSFCNNDKKNEKESNILVDVGSQTIDENKQPIILHNSNIFYCQYVNITNYPLAENTGHADYTTKSVNVFTDNGTMTSETETVSGDVKPRANIFTTKTNIAVVESENSEMRKENLREKDRPVLFQKSNLSEMSSTHRKVQSNNLDKNDISNSEPFNSPEIQSLNEDAKGKLCWNLNNNTDVPIAVDVGEYFSQNS